MPARAKCAFWNVRNLFEVSANQRAPQSHAELSAKLDALARVIGRMGPPPLLALAEVATVRLANEVAARIYRTAAPIPLQMALAPNPSDQTGIVVMGDPSVVAAIDAVAADLGTGAGRPRALAVDVSFIRRRTDHDRLRLVACHWKSELRLGSITPEADRAASGMWLRAHTSALGSTHPVLVMGDMNTEPFTPEVVRFLQARRHYGSTRRGRLYNAMWSWLPEPDSYATTRAPNYVAARPRTTFAGSPARVINHVMVSRALLLRGGPFQLDEASVGFHLDNETATRRPRSGDQVPYTWDVDPATNAWVGSSDHFPLVADLLY